VRRKSPTASPTARPLLLKPRRAPATRRAKCRPPQETRTQEATAARDKDKLLAPAKSSAAESTAPAAEAPIPAPALLVKLPPASQDGEQNEATKRAPSARQDQQRSVVAAKDKPAAPKAASKKNAPKVAAPKPAPKTAPKKEAQKPAAPKAAPKKDAKIESEPAAPYRTKADIKKHFRSKDGIKHAPKEDVELAFKVLGVRKPPKMQESRSLLARIIFEDVPEGALTTPEVSEEEALRKTLVILQQAQLKEQADVIEDLKSAIAAIKTKKPRGRSSERTSATSRSRSRSSSRRSRARDPKRSRRSPSRSSSPEWHRHGGSSRGRSRSRDRRRSRSRSPRKSTGRTAATS
jgi:hypothetical protein